MISVERISPHNHPAYKEFVAACDASLLYHSPEYLSALAKILVEAQAITFAAYDAGEIVGTLTAFLMSNGSVRVLNSLPYFGSHGDILLRRSGDTAGQIVTTIAMALAAYRRETEIGAVNIVSHLHAPKLAQSAGDLGLTEWDYRIGQISRLGTAGDRASALDCVLSACQQKTRNLIRKGMRQQFEIGLSTAESDWHEFIEHHRLGMDRIGGRAKTKLEFDVFRSVLSPRNQCRLYVARKDGVFAGALLNLYYRVWVEYFTPVSAEAHRNDQVLSAVIAYAMCDAILEGFRFWNWGGTWASQAGVYHFKSGWGTVDMPYSYLGAVFDASLLRESPELLRSRFPYFYVRPFGM